MLGNVVHMGGYSIVSGAWRLHKRTKDLGVLLTRYLLIGNIRMMDHSKTGT